MKTLKRQAGMSMLGIIIDANYEKRTPLFEEVDAVLIFDNNVVVID